MQNDPVLVEKVARALAKCSFGTSGDGTEWIGCQPHARAVLAAPEDELASASASPALGKDQVQSEASRHVVPPEWKDISTAPWASTVLVTYFSDDVGEWVIGIACADRPSAPWTHWAYPPPPPAPGIEAEGQDPKELGAEHESPKGAPNRQREGRSE